MKIADMKISKTQKIIVFQENGKGESKIRGVRKHGKDLFELKVISIDGPLPSIIENSEEYFPSTFKADIVLDFLKHPDLSNDLSKICFENNIPVVASGKKLPEKQAITPPT